MMSTESFESFFGTVTGGGEAVSAQSDPGEESDEGELMEKRRIPQAAGAAKEKGADFAHPGGA